MKYLMFLLVSLTFVSSPAFAAKAARHCVDKDNKEIALTAGSKKLSAQCKAAGGKWVRTKAATGTSTTTTTTTTKSK
jgi:hypothetical protein